jgi:hypothetical protein
MNGSGGRASSAIPDGSAPAPRAKSGQDTRANCQPDLDSIVEQLRGKW